MIMMIIKHRFLIAGLIVLLIGIMIFVSKIRLKENGVEGIAVVQHVTEDVEESENVFERKITYNASIEYEVDGKTYSGIYTTESRISKGSLVKIYYDKDNPGIMFTDTDTTISIIIMLIGGFLIMIGLVNIFVKDYMKPEDNV